MGRPKSNIDEVQLLKLATMHCTNIEIAAFFECDPKTITNRYSDVLEIGRKQGKVRLRQMQWKVADKGNCKMLIWLGKQYLDQKEKRETEHILSKDTATLLGMIDGSSKGKLPDEAEDENAE